MTRKSLVTGGAGFLGSHLVDALLARGDEVVIVDNLSTGRVSNVENAVMSGRATFVYGDVATDAQTLSRLVAETNVGRLGRIFHLASPASPEAYFADPWGTLAVNALGTMSLVELALEHSARLVFASTSEVYGDPLEHPQKESYSGNVDPIGPRACYDEGKRFGEAAISVGVGNRGLDARIVRFFNCYGPRMDLHDGRLIPMFLDAFVRGAALPIHGDGSQTRSMTFVDDAVELLLLVAERRSHGLTPVNVGNDEERSVLEIAQAFSATAGIPFRAEFFPARPGDPQRRRPDLSRARSYGWHPSTSLESGLAKTLEWALAERAVCA